MRNIITIWLWTGCFLVFLMVVIGGITRLTGSGLSIVEWNLISGVFPPLTESEWNIAFDKYRQFPQYIKLNKGMKLSEFKFIFFWEYLHRLIGRFIGLVFIIPALFFYVKKSLDPLLIKRFIMILILGALQGVMGWIMVKSGLINNPHVSHYRLAAHFLLACLLISAIFITSLETMKCKRYYVAKNIYYITLTICILLLVQLLYGAFTAGLKAGFAYNTFPTMNGDWIPQDMFNHNPHIINFFDNGITVQFIHRAVGSLLLIVVFTSSVYIFRNIKEPKIIFYFILLLIMVSLQYLLGILTLINKVPLFLGIIHQASAIIVLLTIAFILYSLKPVNSIRNTKSQPIDVIA